MQYRKLNELKKLPNNPRIIRDKQFKTLCDSIRDNPKYFEARPIILSDRTGEMVIIAGNQRYEAAKSLKLKEVPTFLIEGLDEAKEREIIIRDNISNGEFDWDILANEWSDLPLVEWGVDLPEDWLVEEKTDPADAEPQIDRAAELNKIWKVKTGDLWQIGEHRLICGDCTDRAVVERVMGGEVASITFTSPPYNAGVSAKLSGNTSIDDNLYKDEYNDNQSQSDYLSLLEHITKLALSSSQYVFVNIQFLAGNKTAFVDYLSMFRDNLADIAIWDKTHAAPATAQRVMDSRFEFVLIYSHKANRAIGTREFRGMVHNVYSGNPQRNNKYASSHAATFPVDFPEHFIKTFTNESELIFEPFTGTGTTMVACENLNRKCRGIEISPAYCAVILQRMTDAFPGIEIKRLP